MSTSKRTPPTGARAVAAYISDAPPAARPMLRQLRRIIRAAAPQAVEKLSYGMPYYNHHGRLAYYAAFKRHVSLFAWGSPMKQFAREVKPYRTSTGTLQFRYGTTIPAPLIRKLLKARVKDNEAKRKEA